MKWDILGIFTFATCFDIVWYIVDETICEVIKIEGVGTLRKI